MHKKILRLLSIILICFVISGCSDEDIKEISDTITVNAGVQYNNTFHKNAAEQYQTAIINGNIEWMKEIVAANPELNVNYTNEMTAMYCAWWESYDMNYDKAKMVEALLEVGVNPNIGDPLQLSTYNKKYYYTQALLKSDKIKLDTTDSLGTTPLAMAMENHRGGSSIDCHEQVMLMLEAGAEPYAELFHDENEGEEYAVHFPYVEDNPVSGKMLMNMLIESGQSSGLKPALEYAFSGQMDKCLEELKSHSIESEYNKDERYVIYRYFTYYGTPEQFEEARELLNYGFNGFNCEMISLPSETGNYELSKYLLETYPDEFVISGTDANSFALRGFHYAIYWGYADICKLFCDRNVSIEKTAYGYDVLAQAIFSEDLETVKVIYDYIKSKDELNDFEIGRLYKRYSYRDVEKAKEIVDFFFDEGYNLGFMEFGGIDKEFAEYLYSKGRPLNPTDLTYAVQSEDPEFVKLVLEKGADPNQPAFDGFFTEQWNISESGETITYEELVKIGDDCHDAVIFTAVERSNSEVVKMLLDYGADVNTPIVHGNAWSNGLIPIQMAIYSSKATAKVLIEAGANLDVIIDDRPSGITSNAVSYVFTLSEYFEHRGRKDLSDLVKEYQ